MVGSGRRTNPFCSSTPWRVCSKASVPKWPYNDVEGSLDKLLREFGPPRKSSPSYPFDHLASDGLWIVSSDEGPGSPGDGRGRLRSTNAKGCLHPELVATLRPIRHCSHGRPGSCSTPTSNRASRPISLKKSAWTSSLLISPRARSRGRSDVTPKFRNLILVAYEYRCAMCGFDPQVDNVPVRDRRGTRPVVGRGRTRCALGRGVSLLTSSQTLRPRRVGPRYGPCHSRV